MIHCTVVTSVPKPCSIAGRATERAVKSLAMTSTASAMAPSPMICAVLSASACAARSAPVKARSPQPALSDARAPRVARAICHNLARLQP